MKESYLLRTCYVNFAEHLQNTWNVNLLYEDYYTTYQTINKKGIRNILRAAESEKPDITIALLHWGSEYNEDISDSQKSIANLMISEGVDAIIGSHPHLVHQVDFNEEEGTLVA